MLRIPPAHRRNWGDPPQELTAGWTDLFLDLIFVGAAYQLGDMIKYTFYDCTPDADSDGSSGSDGGSSSSGSSSADSADYIYADDHRRLADAAPAACLPWALAWLYALASFGAMTRLWSLPSRGLEPSTPRRPPCGTTQHSPPPPCPPHLPPAPSV